MDEANPSHLYGLSSRGAFLRCRGASIRDGVKRPDALHP